MIDITNVKRYCCEDISLIENYEEAVNSNERYDCHHRLEIQDDEMVSVETLIKNNLYYNRPANELIFLTHSNHTKIHKPSRYMIKGVIKHNDEYKERCRQNMLGKRWYTNGKDNIRSRECPEGYYLGRTFRVANNKGSTGYHWYTNGVDNVSAKECPEGYRLGKIGKPHSEETKKKMSIARSGERNHFFGKHHSEETKKKIGDANRRRKISEETRRKMSESRKGYVFTEESKLKISMAKKGKKGKTPSEETRRKLSEALKGKSKGLGLHYYNNGVINVRRYECPEGFTPGRINNWEDK